MSNLEHGYAFDASTTAPSQGYEPVPTNWYNVTIQASEVKQTSGGDGAFLEQKLVVIDGPYVGRAIFARHNISNPNPQTQAWAEQDVSAICHVTGKLKIAHHHELHGIPFRVRVVIKPAKGEYDASNDVKGFQDSAGNPPGQQGQGQAQGGQPQQFGGQPQNNAAPAQNAQPNPAGTFGGQQQNAAPQGNVPIEGQQSPQGGWGQHAPVQETQPPQNAPVQNAPVQNAPVQNAPVQNAPVQTQAAPTEPQPQGNNGWTQGNQGGAAPWGPQG